MGTAISSSGDAEGAEDEAAAATGEPAEQAGEGSRVIAVGECEVGCDVRVELAAEGTTEPWAVATALMLRAGTGALDDRATTTATDVLHRAHVYCTEKHEQVGCEDDEDAAASVQDEADAADRSSSR